MEFILMSAVVVILSIYLWLQQSDQKLPPFPMRPYPIVGHLLHMDKNPRNQFKQWRKQLGDIFSFKMGGTLVVVLNGYDLIKEALVKKGESFSDRTPVFFDEASGMPGKGIGFSSGPLWKEQRSVALSILRKFGMGKNILAEKIEQEVTAYVDYLASMKGKPTNIRTMTNISTSNVICSIIIGHRFDYDDKEFQALIACLNSTALDQQNVSLINFFSWLKYVPGDFFKGKKIHHNVQVVLGVLNKFINATKNNNTIDDADESDNFISSYISERDKKIKSGVSTYMDDENLTKCILDLFGAGTETTSTTIYWFILYMLNYPNIQEKVYQEIMDVVGPNRTPNIQDRSNLPYLNATILEIQRICSIIPLSLMHKCAEDETLMGYNIPKGTYIVPNLDSVHYDKTIWGKDVMSFRPERFIDEHGKLQDREELIPFGIGRRICLGEAMAKMELFLFLSNMIHRLQFLPAGKVAPPLNDVLFGLVCAPRQYEVRMVPRK